MILLALCSTKSLEAVQGKVLIPILHVHHQPPRKHVRAEGRLTTVNTGARSSKEQADAYPIYYQMYVFVTPVIDEFRRGIFAGGKFVLRLISQHFEYGPQATRLCLRRKLVSTPLTVETGTGSCGVWKSQWWRKTMLSLATSSRHGDI